MREDQQHCKNSHRRIDRPHLSVTAVLFFCAPVRKKLRARGNFLVGRTLVDRVGMVG